MRKSNDMSQMLMSISKLKLSDNIEAILLEHGFVYLTDLSKLNEENLKKIPGIGYASARKILKAYKVYVDSIMKPEFMNLNDLSSEQKRDINTFELEMHPVLEKSNLKLEDKKILNLMIHGYSQQQVTEISNISKRTLRHRLAMLKIEYQAKTLTQLVCNIFDEVILLTE